MTGLSSGEESLGLVWIVTAADNQMTQNGGGGLSKTESPVIRVPGKERYGSCY